LLAVASDEWRSHMKLLFFRTFYGQLISRNTFGQTGTIQR